MWISFKKNKFLLLLGIIFYLLIFSQITLVFSQNAGERCGEIHWPAPPGGDSIDAVWTADGNCQYPNITKVIEYFYRWGIFLGGLAAFIALVLAGIKYLTSMGEPSKMRDAMDGIRMAFFGLALLLGSWLILNAINPDLTEFGEIDFKIEKIPEGGPVCDTDNDCKSSMSNARCKCYSDLKPGDGKKEGTCYCPEPTPPLCEIVILYREPNFKQPYPRPVDSNIGGGPNAGCHSFSGFGWGEEYYPKSSAAIYLLPRPNSNYGVDGKCYLFHQKSGFSVISREVPSEFKADWEKWIPVDYGTEATEYDELIEKSRNKAESCLGAPLVNPNDPTDPWECRCIRCRGQLQIFQGNKCQNMTAALSATNRTISVDTGINSAKLDVQPFMSQDES